MKELIIKSMSSNELISQYNTICDIVDNAWRSVSECDDTQSLVFAVDTEKEQNQLREEIINRKNNGTLYDGKRDVIVKIWNWASGKNFNNDAHKYNTVRSIAEKNGIEMVKYEYSFIFNN